MRSPVELENIEAMRREAGIDDAELHRQIRTLAVGDCVALTLLNLTRVFAEQLLLVRITHIRGAALRGTVLGKRAPAGSPRPRPGTQLTFTTGHIHSIPPAGQPPRPEPVANGRKGRTMTAKPTKPTRPPAARSGDAGPSRPESAPPQTTEERLQRIALLGQRVAESIAFMAQVGTMNGTSPEAKHRSVAAFLDRLTVLERQLALVADELRLG